jgi:hypothetical protein
MWILAQYEKGPGDPLIHDWELDALQAEVLADVFGGAPWEELVYEVTEDERAFVEEIHGARLDLDRYAYFIEAISPGSQSEVITLGSGQRIYMPPRTLPAFPDALPVRPRRRDADT